jgi:hypothetical protein
LEPPGQSFFHQFGGGSQPLQAKKKPEDRTSFFIFSASPGNGVSRQEKFPASAGDGSLKKEFIRCSSWCLFHD